MPFQQHQEKSYTREAASIFQAGLKAVEKLDRKLVSSAPDKLHFEAKFPMVVLGKTLVERTT